MHCSYIFQRGPNKGKPCNKPSRTEFCGSHTPRALQLRRNIAQNHYHGTPELPPEMWTLIATINPIFCSKPFCTCGEDSCKCSTTIPQIFDDYQKYTYLAIRALNKEMSKLPITPFIAMQKTIKQLQLQSFHAYTNRIKPKWWYDDTTTRNEKIRQFVTRRDTIVKQATPIPTTPEEIEKQYVATII